MTDKKAKEILDFLARRAGYCSFAVFYSISEYMPCVLEETGCMKHSLYQIIKPSPIGSKILLSNVNYRNVLSNFLKYSEDGYDIETDNIGEIFLPAHSSLEQILVEMDLETNSKP